MIDGKKFLSKAGTQVLAEEIKKNRKFIKTTWAKLKTLRDTGLLNPGAFYQIIDYTCTTTQDSTQSAGHNFDIIVQALGNSVLSELAGAIAREGDEYFSKSNLAAWQLWYDLDNDVTKYLWADTINGKGVIYRMIDEFGNDCPYDFKNIMFKRYWTDGIDMGGEIILQGYFAHENFFSEGIDVANVAWCYTFNFVENFDDDYSNVWDASLNSAISRAGILPDSDYYASEPCANNVIKQNWVTQILDDASNAALSLNNIVFLNSPDDGNTLMCHGNTFAEFNFDMTFAKNCNSNSFGNNCYSNSFGNNCFGNCFGNNCYSNSFGNNCFGNCFGNYCDSNSFGNYCNSNSFGNYCYSNSFGNYCDSNSFGNYCDSNSFGNYCYSNSFGNYCNSNSFGNYCDSNSFGNHCGFNSFGNYCYSNSFGNHCGFNSFGNYCNSNSFGNNSDKNDMKYDFVSEVRFDDGVSYVNLKPSFVASKSQYICNIHILRGVHGATKIKSDTGYYNWSNTDRRLDVVIDIFSQDYELCVGMTKAGKLKMWANEPTDIQEMTIEEVENKFA